MELTTFNNQLAEIFYLDGFIFIATQDGKYFRRSQTTGTQEISQARHAVNLRAHQENN